MSGNVQIPVDDKDACAHCKECNIDASSKCYKDHAARRAVLTAKVYCSRRNFGCSWTGLSHHLKKHEAECSFHSPGPPICGGNDEPVDAVQTENGGILCTECFNGILYYPNRHCDECNVAVEKDKKHYQGQCKAARIVCVPSPARFKQLVENEGGEIVMPTFKVPRMEYIDPINTLQPAVPESKISVATRAHKFVELDRLINDDQLFIKCIVDTTNIFHP